MSGKRIDEPGLDRPAAPPPDAAALLDLAAGLGERVCDPGHVVDVLRSRTDPGWPQWSPVALSGGPPSVALLLSELHQHDPSAGWEDAAARWAALTTAALGRFPPSGPGWCSGSAGALLTLSSVAAWHDGREVVEARDRTVTQLRAQVRAAVDRLPGTATELDDYDLLTGIAGVVPGLVAARDLGTDVLAEVDAVATVLVAYGTVRDGSPGCRLDPVTYAGTDDRFPDGYVDLGLAHGVPGVLAALAMVVRRVPEAPVVASGVAGGVVSEVVDWLLRHAAPDEAGPNWALGVGAGERPGEAPRGRARAGWCYGVPGVCLALHRAGEALDDPALLGVARDALAAVARRPSSATLLESATICHGLAGVALVAAELGVPELADARASLPSAWDDGARLGVQDLGASGARHDDPGLLTGSTGIGLAALRLAGRPVAALTSTVLQD